MPKSESSDLQSSFASSGEPSGANMTARALAPVALVVGSVAAVAALAFFRRSKKEVAKKGWPSKEQMTAGNGLEQARRRLQEVSDKIGNRYDPSQKAALVAALTEYQREKVRAEANTGDVQRTIAAERESDQLMGNLLGRASFEAAMRIASNIR